MDLGSRWGRRLARNWSAWLWLAFALSQYADPLFLGGTLSTWMDTPARREAAAGPGAAVGHAAAAGHATAGPGAAAGHAGWLERSPLNPFPPGRLAARAHWDGPLVNDPNIASSNRSLLKGEFPFLNPHLGLGVPQFADGISPTFFLGNLGFLLLGPEDWDLVYLAFYIACGWLALWVFRQGYGLGQGGALVGTLVWLASGSFVPQLALGGESFNHFCFVVGVYLAERWRAADLRGDRRGRFLWAAALALLVSQTVYAAMPEGTVANWFMLCAYMILRWDWRAPGRFWNVVGWVAAVFTTALALSAPYLGALAHYATLMSSGHVIGHYAIPWKFALDLVAPFHSGWTFNDFFPGHFPSQLNVPWVGLVPVAALALWLAHLGRPSAHDGPDAGAGGRGAWDPRRAWNPSWLAAALAAAFYVTQAFGSDSLRLNWVGHLPVLEKIFFFRFFSTFFTFAVALLTAACVDRFIRRPPAPRPWAVLALLAAGLGALGWRVRAVAEGLADSLAEGGGGEELARGFLAWNDVVAAPALALAAATYWWAARLGDPPRRRRRAAAVWMAAAALVAAHQIPKGAHAKADPHAPTPAAAWLLDRAAAGGAFRVYSPDRLFPSTAAGVGLDDLRYMIPITPRPTLEALRAHLGPWDGGQIRFDRFEGLADPDDLAPYSSAGFDLLNVRYFLLDERRPERIPSGPNLREAFRGGGEVVVENLDALPRARLKDQWVVVQDHARRLKMVAERTGDLKTLALLDSAPEWPDGGGAGSGGMDPTVGAADRTGGAAAVGGAGVEVLSRSNHTWRLRVRSAGRAILVVADAALPGHRATVDGAPTRALSVDGGLIGVAAPAGVSIIEIVYRPPHWPAFVALFAAGALALAALLAAGWRAGRDPGAP